jgi:hypothetical protein
LFPVESWPLIVAGPIVRRVEPNSVAVWVALKEPRAVRLSVFDAPIDTGGGTGPFAEPAALMSNVTRTLRVGANLHVVVATTDSDDPLLPGHIYAYNLAFGPHGQEPFSPVDDLRSLRLLQDFFPPAPAAGSDPVPPTPLAPAHVNLALGYEANLLPTFVTPADDLTELRIAHGSCRLAKARATDMLGELDAAIDAKRTVATARPQQLFMTGDQVYADEVAPALAHLCTEIGNALLGTVEKLTVSWAPPGGTGALGPLPCDHVHFPVGLRRPLVTQDARLSTIEGESHVLSLAEYCALYVLGWSNVLWPQKLPSFEDLFWKETLPDAQFPGVVAGDALPPPIWQLHLGLFKGSKDGLKDEFHATEKLETFTAEAAGEVLQEKLNSEEAKEKYDQESEKDPGDIKQFRASLAKVRRALANVATYMIFDDHDVTDDWNLSLAWRDRVYTSPLGRTVLRNGLTAYLLFQGWGNDPAAAFEDLPGEGAPTPSPLKRLLQLVPQIFPADAAPNHDNSTVVGEVETLLGLDEGDPAAKWHYRVDGPRHRVLVLDTRTRRGFGTHTGAPSGLSLSAMHDQLPGLTEVTIPAGIEVVFVVSPIPLLGVPLIDEFGGQLAVRALDLFKSGAAATLPGTFPDAGESWANVPAELESVLARIAAYRRAIVLSGDVHFGHGTELSYWAAEDEQPARMAQFTASGFRQIWPEAVMILNRVFTSFDRIVDLERPVERMGWHAGVPKPIEVPDLTRLNPGLRLALVREPLLWPGVPLPTGSSVRRPPDFAWRAALVTDKRPHDQLPGGAKPAPLDPENPEVDATPDLAGYRLAARRHAAHLEKTSHTRKLLFASNYGIVTFLRDEEGRITARHELFAKPGGGAAGAFTRHDIALDVPPEPMPAPVIAGA